jgi:uncharacterized protein (DUF1800 family)
MDIRELKHLFWRAGFGIQPKNFKSNKVARKQVVNSLFDASKSITPLSIDLSYLDKINPRDLKGNPTLIKEINKKNKEKYIALNTAWITHLMNPKELLRERMTLFWANHFVCKDRNPQHIQRYNNVLRENALGNFREFVTAISKQAAMLKYLNGKQNRKSKPNENFARELMELFTIGEGQYSEKDIKESARAFTGYNHDFKGTFKINSYQHDNGQKTFFGETGNFSGDDIIDIILKKKQCALFISTKIYRYFVNPLPNKRHIDAMANVFYKDYNIENLMRFVFMSDWFYDEKNIGAKIKSPIEFLVGMANTIPIKFERDKDLLKIQKLLGQTLLNPPNVAGWKGNKAWIDANTIMIRLKLPSLLLNNAVISLKKEGDFNDSFRDKYFKRNKGKLPFKTIPNWDEFITNYEIVKSEDLSEIVIQGKVNKGTLEYLDTLNQKSKRDYCIQLMSLPEYQIC